MAKKTTFTNREQFNVEYANTKADEIQKEILYNLKENNKIAEKVRANTGTLITWLIIIPLVIGLIVMVLTMPTMK